MYIYIYIYVCVCVCAFNLLVDMQGVPLGGWSSMGWFYFYIVMLYVHIYIYICVCAFNLFG